MLTNIDRAQILSEALPYIQKFHGKTMVVKYGGGAMQSDELRRAVISDIVLLSLAGIRVVVVHGGGPEINDLLTRLGKQPTFVDGLRYTDEETMDVVQMVLCGRVGKQLAQLIGEQGGRALSLSGLDGRMMIARKRSGGKDLGLVGDLVTVSAEPITHALAGGYIPVVSTVACGEEPGQVFNINADTAAAKLAVALGAEKLILLTDVRGLMRDPKDENTLFPRVTLPEVPRLVKEGVISGGMIPKVDCCVEAVRQGVRRAHIVDGRIPHSILIEMLSKKGIGTMIQ
ncbi:MAG: acetylglutamate kinase [Oscillospiraceae bacterium]|jgi:acetylglutamate kinase|nr:acetylglutamate kinase [Oscillospiraceae bacterium]